MGLERFSMTLFQPVQALKVGGIPSAVFHWGAWSVCHQSCLVWEEVGGAFCSQKIHAVDKHQKVPEIAQLWTMVMEFQQASVPLFVTLAMHLLGKIFNEVVVDGKVVGNMA
jgi:hypothetical protein